IGHTLRAEVDATVDPSLTVVEAHDLAHHAERHLLAQLRRLTAATVCTSPKGAHAYLGAHPASVDACAWPVRPTTDHRFPSIQRSLYRRGVETLTHAEVLARFGHALSDPTRSRVLLALRARPSSPAALAT